MTTNNPWLNPIVKEVQTASHISGGFSVRFDPAIPQQTQLELRRFVEWVEKNFTIPIDLYVDFEYRHYLLDRCRRHVGYLFYWSDFDPSSLFNDVNNAPVICLPVRTEHSSLDDILRSFIEAICCYFMWLAGNMDAHKEYVPSEGHVEEILQAYPRRPQT